MNLDDKTNRQTNKQLIKADDYHSSPSYYYIQTASIILIIIILATLHP